MRAVSVVLSLSLLACFPHDKHARTISQYSEGGAVLLGIGILALAGTQADCDAMHGAGMPTMDCNSKATALSDIGLSLLVAGLVGFIATVATAEDDPPPPTNVITTPKEPLPPVQSPIPLASPAPAPSTN